MRTESNTPLYRRMRYHVLRELEQKLDKVLWYHGIHHTRDVLDVCNGYIRRLKLSSEDRLVLRTAAVLHDYGFLFSYSSHEEEGCKAARRILPAYAYPDDMIDRVCELIMATKIPQSASSLLEEILCDADLDYLGRDDFSAVADSLFKELKDKGALESRAEWNLIQFKFLKKHSYYTDYAQKYRLPRKLKNRNKIEGWLKKHSPGYLTE